MLNGTALPSEGLIDLRVETAIGLAARCNMRLRYDLTAWTPVIGDEISVTMTGQDNAKTEVFKGEIVSIGAEIDSAGSELTITAYDRAHRLNLATKTRAFTKQSYADVIGTIASEHGLQSQADSSLSSLKHDYLVQATTNHAFLTEICLRTGCEWYVDSNKLVVRQRGTADSGITLALSEDLLRVRVRYSAAEHATNVKVMGWDTKKKQGIVAQHSAALTTTPSGAPPAFTGASSDKGKFGDVMVQTSTLPPLTQDEADAVAKGLSVRLSTTKMIVKGEALATPKLKIGFTVSLDKVGPKLKGKYYVTAVEHVYGTNRSATTRFTAGGLEPSSLVDLLGSGDHGVAPWSQLGVVIGIVTNNDQTDDGTKPGPGRVKVKFPTLGDNVESAPARLVSIDAGKGRGAYNVPEINDEVLVAFEHGDPRRPYVLGSVWSGADKPPTFSEIVKNGKVMARHMKTRAGHTMTWNDGEDDAKKNLTILLADGKTTLILGHEKIDIITDKKPIKISNGDATITLKDNGDIEMKAKNIKLDAQTKVTINGQDIENTAKAGFKVSANAAVEIKGNAPSKFESAAILTLKGALVKIN